MGMRNRKQENGKAGIEKLRREGLMKAGVG